MMEFIETLDINTIITDDDCLLQMQDIGSPVEKSTVTVKTNLQIISDVCTSLAKDNCLTPEDRAFFNQVDMHELLKKIQFLDDCLVPRKMFVRASREKAWKNYAAYVKNISSLMEYTKSASAAAWLCLKTFEKLVALIYPTNAESPQACQPPSLEDNVKQIICHIGGSIITKLTRFFKGEEEQQCVRALCTKHETSMLTATLNRGGLIYLNEKAQEFFYAVEYSFLLMCQSTPSSCTGVDFATACADDEELLNKFYSITYKTNMTETVKHRVFSMVIRLYFQIRINVHGFTV